MNIHQFIACMLVLIFIALAWRFLLVIGVLVTSFFLWFLIVAFIKGMVQAVKEEIHTSE